MQNIFNIDFYESMDIVRSYLEIIEDEFIIIKEEFKNNLEGYNKVIEEYKNDKTEVYSLSDSLYMLLQNNDYQSFANSLLLLEVVDMLHRESIEDIDYIWDYIESINEESFLEDVTETIINYNIEG